MSSSAQAPSFETQAPRMGLIPGFDGFRGAAMLMVLLVHATGPLLESYATLVDSFFVLSGFLITTLLFQEHRSTKGINLRKFYQRRAIRLFPSVWLFGAVWIVIALIATFIGFEQLHIRHVGADVAAMVGYVYHLFFPVGLGVIEPGIQEHRTMWHLWTLSIEEWFYIFIAGTVFVCIRRNWIKALGIIMMAGVVIIGAARWFAFTGFYQDTDGVLPGIRLAFLQRPDGLMLGVALAVLNAYMDEAFIRRVRRPVLIIAGISAVVWLVTLNTGSRIWSRLGLPFFEYLPTDGDGFTREQMLEQMYWFRFGHTVCVLAFAVMTFALVHYWDWWLSRWWSWGPLQYVGRLSYTLYIWHALPFVILFALTGGEDASTTVSVLRIPFLFAATFLIAVPVYKYVEMPALKLKLKFAGESEVLDRRTGKFVRTDGSDPDTPASAEGNRGTADLSDEPLDDEPAEADER